MVDQLVQGLEFSLANTVQSIFYVYSEVLVASGGFQRHAEVAHLCGKWREASENSQRNL